MRPRAPFSRASIEPLHDHISAAGQCTVRARSEAAISHLTRPRSQPLDHLPTDRSTRHEHKLVRLALNSDIFDREDRQDKDHDNIEDGKQPQQEVKEDVAAALVTGRLAIPIYPVRRMKAQDSPTAIHLQSQVKTS